MDMIRGFARKENAMRITCDKEVDALRIIFRETTVTSRELGDGIAIDLDEDGRLAGIEVLDAMSRFGDKDTLKKSGVRGNRRGGMTVRTRARPLNAGCWDMFEAF